MFTSTRDNYAKELQSSQHQNLNNLLEDLPDRFLALYVEIDPEFKCKYEDREGSESNHYTFRNLDREKYRKSALKPGLISTGGGGGYGLAYVRPETGRYHRGIYEQYGIIVDEGGGDLGRSGIGIWDPRRNFTTIQTLGVDVDFNLPVVLVRLNLWLTYFTSIGDFVKDHKWVREISFKTFGTIPSLVVDNSSSGENDEHQVVDFAKGLRFVHKFEMNYYDNTETKSCQAQGRDSADESTISSKSGSQGVHFLKGGSVVLRDSQESLAVLRLGICMADYTELNLTRFCALREIYLRNIFTPPMPASRKDLQSCNPNLKRTQGIMLARVQLHFHSCERFSRVFNRNPNDSDDLHVTRTWWRDSMPWNGNYKADSMHFDLICGNMYQEGDNSRSLVDLSGLELPWQAFSRVKFSHLLLDSTLLKSIKNHLNSTGSTAEEEQEQQRDKGRRGTARAGFSPMSPYSKPYSSIHSGGKNVLFDLFHCYNCLWDFNHNCSDGGGAETFSARVVSLQNLRSPPKSRAINSKHADKEICFGDGSGIQHLVVTCMVEEEFNGEVDGNRRTTAPVLILKGQSEQPANGGLYILHVEDCILRDLNAFQYSPPSSTVYLDNRDDVSFLHEVHLLRTQTVDFSGLLRFRHITPTQRADFTEDGQSFGGNLSAFPHLLTLRLEGLPAMGHLINTAAAVLSSRDGDDKSLKRFALNDWFPNLREFTCAMCEIEHLPVQMFARFIFSKKSEKGFESASTTSNRPSPAMEKDGFINLNSKPGTCSSLEKVNLSRNSLSEVSFEMFRGIGIQCVEHLWLNMSSKEAQMGVIRETKPVRGGSLDLSWNSLRQLPSLCRRTGRRRRKQQEKPTIFTNTTATINARKPRGVFMEVMLPSDELTCRIVAYNFAYNAIELMEETADLGDHEIRSSTSRSGGGGGDLVVDPIHYVLPHCLPAQTCSFNISRNRLGSTSGHRPSVAASPSSLDAPAMTRIDVSFLFAMCSRCGCDQPVMLDVSHNVMEALQFEINPSGSSGGGDAFSNSYSDSESEENTSPSSPRRPTSTGDPQIFSGQNGDEDYDDGEGRFIQCVCLDASMNRLRPQAGKETTAASQPLFVTRETRTFSPDLHYMHGGDDDDDDDIDDGGGKIPTFTRHKHLTCLNSVRLGCPDQITFRGNTNLTRLSRQAFTCQGRSFFNTSSVVDFSQCGLTLVESGILTGLASLTVLNMSRNALTKSSLNRGFMNSSCSRHLCTVDLSHNRICSGDQDGDVSSPPDYSQWFLNTPVHTLDLSHNRIRTFPHSLMRLVNHLQLFQYRRERDYFRLWLHHNNLTDVFSTQQVCLSLLDSPQHASPCGGVLRRLQLNMKGKRMAGASSIRATTEGGVREGTARSVCRMELDVSYNQIEFFHPATLTNCTSALMLNLDYNPIRSLPGETYGHNSRWVQLLSLQGTRVKSLPYNFLYQSLIGLSSLRIALEEDDETTIFNRGASLSSSSSISTGENHVDNLEVVMCCSLRLSGLDLNSHVKSIGASERREHGDNLVDVMRDPGTMLFLKTPCFYLEEEVEGGDDGGGSDDRGMRRKWVKKRTTVGRFFYNNVDQESSSGTTQNGSVLCKDCVDNQNMACAGGGKGMCTRARDHVQMKVCVCKEAPLKHMNSAPRDPGDTSSAPSSSQLYFLPKNLYLYEAYYGDGFVCDQIGDGSFFPRENNSHGDVKTFAYLFVSFIMSYMLASIAGVFMCEQKGNTEPSMWRKMGCDGGGADASDEDDDTSLNSICMSLPRTERRTSSGSEGDHQHVLHSAAEAMYPALHSRDFRKAMRREEQRQWAMMKRKPHTRSAIPCALSFQYDYEDEEPPFRPSSATSSVPAVMMTRERHWIAGQNHMDDFACRYISPMTRPPSGESSPDKHLIAASHDGDNGNAPLAYLPGMLYTLHVEHKHHPLPGPHPVGGVPSSRRETQDDEVAYEGEEDSRSSSLYTYVYTYVYVRK